MKTLYLWQHRTVLVICWEKIRRESLDKMKTEQICRTCLHDEGRFFNISHTFDQLTLLQMIQDITSLQVTYSDGYTQSVCCKCVKEVRRAHKFRRKCLESNENLVQLSVKSLEDVLVTKNSFLVKPNLEDIKEESDDSDSFQDLTETEYSGELNEQNPPTDDNIFFPKVENVKQELTECNIFPEIFIENKPSSSLTNNHGIKHELSNNVENKRNLKIIFSCPLCNGLFINRNAFINHIEELHPDKTQDESLKEKFVPLGLITKQKTPKKNYKYFYKCNADDFVGNSIKEFKNHMNEHMGKKPIICTDCNFRTTNIRQLKKHRIQIHTKGKMYSCSQCSYSCKNPQSLKYHSYKHSNEKNYQCKLCLMTFKRPSDVSVHKRVKHEKRKIHACPVCQKSFYHKKEMNVHMSVHTGERSHICDFCGLAFTQIGNLRTHVSLKHLPSDKTFNCEHCKYTTNHKIRLTAHIKKHFAEKKFKCVHCPFKSHRKSTIKLHMTTHFKSEVDKKFACDICDYKCITSSRMKIHKRDHSDERPFPCSICSYRAKSKYALARHSQTHNTELKFICHNCPYRTNTRELLLKHLRNKCVIKKRGRRPAAQSASTPESPYNLTHHKIEFNPEEPY